MYRMLKPTILALSLLASSMPSQAVSPVGALASLDFLVGTWQADEGQVMDTGGTSKGVSAITAELGGTVLLRRDHTDLFDKAGAPSGGFDQLMTIYAESAGIRADYLDGEHVIHYVSADVTPGQAVTFTSAPGAGPVFRLSYRLESPTTLKVTFGMIPPGQTELHPIATGTLHRR